MTDEIELRLIYTKKYDKNKDEWVERTEPRIESVKILKDFCNSNPSAKIYDVYEFETEYMYKFLKTDLIMEVEMIIDGVMEEVQLEWMVWNDNYKENGNRKNREYTNDDFTECCSLIYNKETKTWHDYY
jgi:hypothetical protein